MKIINKILLKIGQFLMALAVLAYLCQLVIQNKVNSTHNYISLTWWSWKTRFKWTKRKIKRSLNKIWNFLKTLRWSWIFVIYAITFFVNVLCKNWVYVDYIWLCAFLTLMIMLAIESFYP